MATWWNWCAQYCTRMSRFYFLNTAKTVKRNKFWQDTRCNLSIFCACVCECVCVCARGSPRLVFALVHEHMCLCVCILAYTNVSAVSWCPVCMSLCKCSLYVKRAYVCALMLELYAHTSANAVSYMYVRVYVRKSARLLHVSMYEHMCVCLRHAFIRKFYGILCPKCMSLYKCGLSTKRCARMLERTSANVVCVCVRVREFIPMCVNWNSTDN